MTTEFNLLITKIPLTLLMILIILLMAKIPIVAKLLVPDKFITNFSEKLILQIFQRILSTSTKNIPLPKCNNQAEYRLIDINFDNDKIL